MERFGDGANINSSYEMLCEDDDKANRMIKRNNQKVNALIALGFISTLILLFILCLGIYVYVSEHGNIQKVNHFIGEIDENVIAKIIDDTTHFMETLNMTRDPSSHGRDYFQHSDNIGYI